MFLVSITASYDIENILSLFWWGHNRAQSKGIHRISWERFCVHKKYGGMGFKNLRAFNYVMPGKQTWKSMRKPESLVTKLFKAKYYPHSNFFNSNIGHNPSYV
jgi:hypothetical protein